MQFIFFNDRGLRAGWRLIIFIAILFCLVLLIAFPLQSIARKQAATGALDPGPQIISESLTFLVILIASWIMSKIEKRSMGHYGLPLQDAAIVRRLVTGYVFWGFIPLTVCLLVLHFFHAFDFGNFALHGADIVRWGFAWFVGFMLVGFAEEYLLRGYPVLLLISIEHQDCGALLTK